MPKSAPSVAFCTLLACLASGCATHQGGGGKPPGSPPPAVTVTADSFFRVDGVDKFGGGCKIEVEPEKHKQKVRIREGSVAAWIATNYCSDAAGLELLDFIHQSGSHHSFDDLFESPIKESRLWAGRVKSSAKKGKYKYTAKIGALVKDPDIIIF